MQGKVTALESEVAALEEQVVAWRATLAKARALAAEQMTEIQKLNPGARTGAAIRCTNAIVNLRSRASRVSLREQTTTNHDGEDGSQLRHGEDVAPSRSLAARGAGPAGPSPSAPLRRAAGVHLERSGAAAASRLHREVPAGSALPALSSYPEGPAAAEDLLLRSSLLPQACFGEAVDMPAASTGRPAAATASADANTNTAQPPPLLVREEPRSPPPPQQQQQPAPLYYSAVVPWDVQCGGSSAQQRTVLATSCYGPPDAAAPLPLPLPQRDLTAWMASSDDCPSGPEQLPPLPIAGQACSAAAGANHGPPAVQPPPPLLQLSELTSTASRHSNNGQALRTSGSGSGDMPGDTYADPAAARAAWPTTTLLLPPPPLPCPGPLPLLYSDHNALLGLPNEGVGVRRLSAFSASGTTAGGGSSAAGLMILPAASAAAIDARLQWQQHGGVRTNTISTDSSFGLPHHHRHRALTPRCCHTSASAATTPSVCTAAAAATAVADPDSGCSIFDSPPLAEMLSAALVEPPAADAHAAAGATASDAAAAPAEVRDLYDAWRANPEEHEPEPPTSSGDAGGIIQGGRRPPASRHFLQPGAFNLGPADHSHPHLPSAAAAGAAVAAPPVTAFAAHAHGDHDIAPQAWQDLQQQQPEKRGQEQGQGQEHEEGLLLPPPLAHTASDASSVVCAAGSGSAWDTGVAAATATGGLGKSAVAADLLAGREASAHADASSVPVSPALVAAAPASAVTATMV
ncbi:hypothetical protein HYH02_005631 [Chlamydomonas schloesseri]|uniref:Uncharacterized protein n=1 Tax=Chlamydomonas schloesseri TaxID=2026947 RepID=A0A835WKX9_9CHLO|nr:hypothetical protein HYH02_005631 [Chlamydomonas schloesseri]|eukprot:KAG2449487.1 hypothetical protein HYH02_005631 [Chlamydomonas schloesseri]